MTAGIANLARRVWPLIRRYGFDALVLLAMLEVALELAFGREHNKDAPTGSLWLLIPLSIAILAPLLARRRFPFAAPAAVYLYCAAISFYNGNLVTFSFGIFLAVLTSAFLMGMLPDRSQSVSGLAIGVGAAAIVVHNDPDQGWGDFFFISLLFTIVWLAGNALGAKLTQYRQAEERAARLEREREERARTAVAEERARIARELHDVVGHSVSVMTVQASGVRRLLRPEQEREREALLIVEQTGREALAEMRRLVDVLRRPEEAPALAPQPSLQHLDKLVDQVRESGLNVELKVEGDVAKLPASVDLAAYRLVQEGLTNTLKHAQAHRAEVLVRYGNGEVEVVVADDGNGTGGGAGGGHGLVGLRERIAVAGGELDAGPRTGGGFQVRARLPMNGK
ncbi:MAG TPA: histidine kinase [Gaiellaceae bacterium]|nr:histidine kinase [Gaiellaceae bacterium]